jgi:hypothetical protein
MFLRGLPHRSEKAWAVGGTCPKKRISGWATEEKRKLGSANQCRDQPVNGDYMSDINTTTIVNRAEEIIEGAMSDKKLDITQKAKIVGAMLATQLKAGALNLGYQRAVSRLPEGSATMVPQLNAPPDKKGPNASVQ